jgi:hypothetical protein
VKQCIVQAVGKCPGCRARRGVAVQQWLFGGVGPVRDSVGDPAFQPHHLFISGRQGADGDEHAAELLDWLAGRQFIESLVGERTSGQVMQDRRECAPGEPGRDRVGPVRFGEGVVERLQAWTDLAAIVAEQFAKSLLEDAVGAPTASIVDAPGIYPM